MEGITDSLIWVTILASACNDWGNPYRSSVKVSWCLGWDLNRHIWIPQPTCLLSPYHQLLISSYAVLTGTFGILHSAFHCRRDLLDRHSRRCYSESNAWWQAYWEHYSGWPADCRWYCCRLNRKKGISEAVLICVNTSGFICGQNNGLPRFIFFKYKYIYIYICVHTHSQSHTLI